MSDHQIILDPYEILSLSATRLPPTEDATEADNNAFRDIVDKHPSLGDTWGFHDFIATLTYWMNQHHWPDDGNPDAPSWGFTHEGNIDDNGIQLWFTHDDEDQMLIEVVTVGTWLTYGNDYDFSDSIDALLQDEMDSKVISGTPCDIG